jgi:hypothetical protein
MSEKQADRYPGQGDAVPEHFGRDGYWISEPALWLALDGEPPEDHDMAVTAPDAPWLPSWPVSAPQIASLMGISVEAVVEANQRGALRVANRVVDPPPGFDLAMRFEFRIGRRLHCGFTEARHSLPGA